MKFKKIFFLLNALLSMTWFVIFFFLLHDIFEINKLIKYIKMQPVNYKNLELKESKLNSLNELTAKHNLYMVNKKVSFYETNGSCVAAKHDFVFFGNYLNFLSLIEDLEESDILLKVYSLKLENEDHGNLKIEVKVDVLHKCG